ncbi:MAG TPA: metallophosphoesterase [Vicinamibacterales bacterium]|nr:metallophosphoesterase [Vicinamibacterales bacterium]
MRRSLLFVLMLLVLAVSALVAQDLTLPMKSGSVKFAVIGDTGTGDKHQLAVAKQLAATRAKFPFEFVIMVGDNIYGGNSARDYDRKFAIPYKPLLDANIKFYAALGNHDDPSERYYKPFNMSGERYYTFKPADGVRFFALDSNYMDEMQLKWLDEQLATSGSEWKIAFFHHPPYSSGETHGSNETLRTQLEPRFVKAGVNVVLTGHEHFYERIKPQKGIAYFITGSSAKLREGNITQTELTAKGFDSGYTFMVVEIVGNDLYYQAITDTGKIVDSGRVQRVGKVEPTPNRTAQPVVATGGSDKKTPSKPVK